jgi:hypothetical protein
MLPFGFGRERFVYRWAAAEFEAEREPAALTISECPSMRSADQERETLPLASHKRGAVDCTAAQAVAAGPAGERNGQFRHGERTKAAIAALG